MSELKAYQVDKFLQNKSVKSGVYLVYGSDAGLVHERSLSLCKNATAQNSGQFNFADEVISIDMGELDTNPSRLAVEALTQSMFGGAPVIKIRSATKNLAPILAELLEQDIGALIVIEAASLTKRDKLRVLVEENPKGLTLPSFSDDVNALKALVQNTFQAENINISPEAFSYLCSVFGNDREVTRRELEKLILFADDSKMITLEDVESLCGDNSILALDRIADAVGLGNPQMLEFALNRAYDSGLDSQLLLNASARHFQFLRTVRNKMDAGSNLNSALSNTYPRPHFSRKSTIETQVQKWTVSRIAPASKRIFETTLASRKNIALSETITRRALLGLCLAAGKY